MRPICIPLQRRTIILGIIEIVLCGVIILALIATIVSLALQGTSSEVGMYEYSGLYTTVYENNKTLTIIPFYKYDFTVIFGILELIIYILLVFITELGLSFYLIHVAKKPKKKCIESCWIWLDFSKYPWMVNLLCFCMTALLECLTITQCICGIIWCFFKLYMMLVVYFFINELEDDFKTDGPSPSSDPSNLLSLSEDNRDNATSTSNTNLKNTQSAAIQTDMDIVDPNKGRTMAANIFGWQPCAMIQMRKIHPFCSSTSLQNGMLITLTTNIVICCFIVIIHVWSIVVHIIVLSESSSKMDDVYKERTTYIIIDIVTVLFYLVVLVSSFCFICVARKRLTKHCKAVLLFNQYLWILNIFIFFLCAVFYHKFYLSQLICGFIWGIYEIYVFVAMYYVIKNLEEKEPPIFIVTPPEAPSTNVASGDSLPDQIQQPINTYTHK